MIPISLDPAQVRIGLAGAGPLLVPRLTLLKDLGALPEVFAPAPDEALAALAGAQLHARLPDRADIAPLQVLWIAGLDDTTSAALADIARGLKTLVNVEDVLPYCDFHTPAVVRRGRLILSASTGGASPAAAGVARETLARAFPEVWSEALEEVAAARAAARTAGLGGKAIAEEARSILARRGLILRDPAD